MTKVSSNSIFYKVYLIYNLYFRYNAYKKRDSYSQDKEDLFVNNYFKDIKDGFYLDIGSFHPIKYNNTALLYNRGWRGINIDMNQTSIDLFNIIRKRDINICSAMSNSNREVTQFFDHSYSPVNTIDKNFSKMISKKLSIKPFLEKKIFTYTFNQIVEKKNIKIKKIDFLNIDVEAHDLEVLQGIDLLSYKPRIICIEMENYQNNFKDKKIVNYLKKFDYSLIQRIGLNGFFEKNN